MKYYFAIGMPPDDHEVFAANLRTALFPVIRPECKCLKGKKVHPHVREYKIYEVQIMDGAKDGLEMWLSDWLNINKALLEKYNYLERCKNFILRCFGFRAMNTTVKPKQVITNVRGMMLATLDDCPDKLLCPFCKTPIKRTYF